MRMLSRRLLLLSLLCGLNCFNAKPSQRAGFLRTSNLSIILWAANGRVAELGGRRDKRHVRQYSTSSSISYNSMRVWKSNKDLQTYYYKSRELEKIASLRENERERYKVYKRRLWLVGIKQ